MGDYKNHGHDRCAVGSVEWHFHNYAAHDPETGEDDGPGGAYHHCIGKADNPYRIEHRAGGGHAINSEYARGHGEKVKPTWFRFADKTKGRNGWWVMESGEQISVSKVPPEFKKGRTIEPGRSVMMLDAPFLLSVDGETLRVTMALESSDIGDDPEPKVWLTVLTTGKGTGKPLSGSADLAIDDKWLARLVENKPARVSVDLHHAKYQAAKKKDPRFLAPELSGARAFITDWRIVGEALQGLWEFTAKGAALVRDRSFPFPSLEFTKDKIVGCTLTPDPYWDVPAFALSGGRITNITTAADAGGATPEPKQNPSAPDTPVATQEETVSDEIKALASVLGVDEDKVQATITALQADKAAADDRIVALEARIEAAESDKDKAQADGGKLSETVQTLSTQLTGLAENLATLQAKDRETREEAEIADLLAKGKIENDETVIAAARLSFNTQEDTGVKVFDGGYKARKTGSAVPVNEIGHDSADERAEAVALSNPIAAAEFIDSKVKALQAEHEGWAYADALQAAIEAHPDAFALSCGDTAKEV